MSPRNFWGRDFRESGASKLAQRGGNAQAHLAESETLKKKKKKKVHLSKWLVVLCVYTKEAGE